MSLPAKPVPFGEWLPDLPPTEQTGALIAKNCIPQLKSYGELLSLSAFTDALTSAALGGMWMQGPDNSIENFAGNATQLYHLTVDNTVWANVSQAGDYVGAVNWEMVKFGDRVIAVDIGIDPQYYVTGIGATLFADLAGTPPKAARIGIVRDFVVLGDLPLAPDRIQWSGFNSSELWTPSRATQSDFQTLHGSGGRVQRVVPGQYGVIMQEHSIQRMDYVGPPPIFRIDEAEKNRGTPAGNSVCWTGKNIFYYGHDGFYLFNGTLSEPIGANRVDKWFKNNLDDSAIGSVRGVVDRRNRLVIWAFATSSALGYNDRLIIFNWAANRWSYAELDTELLLEYVTSGLTLEDLDTLYPGPNGIDGANQVPFDSNAYKGGSLNLQVFDTAHKSATFDGAALTAQLDTHEIVDNDDGLVFTNGVRPEVTGNPSTSITVQVGKRDLSTDNVVFSPARALNTIGIANAKAKSRYQRYRCNISGGFEHATGVKLKGRTGAGKR